MTKTKRRTGQPCIQRNMNICGGCGHRSRYLAHAKRALYHYNNNNNNNKTLFNEGLH